MGLKRCVCSLNVFWTHCQLPNDHFTRRPWRVLRFLFYPPFDLLLQLLKTLFLSFFKSFWPDISKWDLIVFEHFFTFNFCIWTSDQFHYCIFVGSFLSSHKNCKKKENVPSRPVLVNLRPFTVLNNNETKERNKATNKQNERKQNYQTNNVWKVRTKNSSYGATVIQPQKKPQLWQNRKCVFKTKFLESAA